MKYSLIGEKHKTNEGYNVKIINYSSYKDCDIQFEDGFITTTTYQNIKKGQVKNPYYPSVFGIGYLGTGIYKTKINRKKTKVYKVWTSMLQRVYYTLYKEKYPTYKDVTVCEEWHNFQNFAEWMEENWKPWMDSSWDLDKDILFKGNKIYSPETCCFVPREINILTIKNNKRRGCYPIGVSKWGNKFKTTTGKGKNCFYLGLFPTIQQAFVEYKKAKQQYIKEEANKWKSQITDQVYNALINYKVEIDD